MARPLIEIDMERLAALMRFKPTQADAAAFFKCSEDTIERRIRETTGLSFAEFREQNMVHTRFSLVQSALDRAKKSDTMLIFCLKNLVGWRDKQPGEADVVVNNVANKSEEELDARIEELMRKRGAENDSQG